VRVGARPADLEPRAPARPVAPLDPPSPSSRRRRAGRLARRAAIGAGAALGAGLAGLALERVGLASILGALLGATPVWMLVASFLMCFALLVRAEAWHAILRAALPGTPVRRVDVTRGAMVGVLMSATLPARLGEPSRALVVARRLGRAREQLPLVLGTVVSQTLLNVLALVVLGAIMLSTVGLFRGNVDKLGLATLGPILLLAAVFGAPALLDGRQARLASFGRALGPVRAALARARRGLDVFRHPRLGPYAVTLQLLAWAIQWLACYALLVAFGLEQAGLGAAAAVLFAVNLTGLFPLAPSNIGVFQAACVAVLSAYGVSKGHALAYGIVLQALEIATAVAVGAPALVAEGMSWKDMRLRALHAAPVELAVRGRRREAVEAEA
jgi:phosphatidylinositol alpha-mannosyltransferase